MIVRPASEAPCSIRMALQLQRPGWMAPDFSGLNAMPESDLTKCEDIVDVVDAVDAEEDFLEDCELELKSLLAVGDGGGRGGPWTRADCLLAC